MIVVIATIDVAPGTREPFLEILAELTPKVLAEKGCIEYAATIDIPTDLPPQLPLRDDTVVMVEKWESLEALEAHLMAPHMNEFRKATETMRRGMTLQVLRPAAG